MIATGAKSHHGRKFIGMIDHLPYVKVSKRLSGRDGTANKTVVEIEALGTPEYMARTYRGHAANIP